MPAEVGSYERCSTCKQWGWMGSHRCAPTWDWRYFWHADHASDWIIGEVYARDAEDAAEEAAKSYDTEDCPLSRGGEVVIEVRRTGTEDATKWTAAAELEPRYYVTADH